MMTIMVQTGNYLVKFDWSGESKSKRKSSNRWKEQNKTKNQAHGHLCSWGFQYFCILFFGISVFLHFCISVLQVSEINKTGHKSPGHIFAVGYFSSARGMVSYGIRFQINLGAPVVFYISSPIVFRPRIVFALILHLFRTSLCFAVSPIIASWLLEMRTVLKSNFIQSALKCIYGERLRQMTTHRESNSIQSTAMLGLNRGQSSDVVTAEEWTEG